MKKQKEVSTLEEEVLEPANTIDLNYCHDFASECDTKSEDTVKEYIYPRLEKLINDGYHVISSILSHPNVVIKSMSFALLDEERSFPKQFKVKLVDEPQSPISIHDPNGALLPVDKRGKVLAAKVGMNGDGKRISPENMERQYNAAMFNSNLKKARAQYGYKMAPYISVEIGKTPVSLSKADAIAVLQTYGIGVGKKEKNWLVEELPI